MTRPLELVVVGNSTSIMTSPARAHRAQGTYGELLADRLEAAGHRTNLHLEGRWFDLAPRAMRAYDERVARHAPDVLVLQFGLNESQPWLLPVWALRHLLTDHRATRPTALWYRQHVAAPVWTGVRAYRRRAAAAVGTRSWQVGPDRFLAAMHRMITVARRQFRPLVLVLDVPPPGARLEHFLPGQAARHAIVQRTLQELVDGIADPEVRLVPVSQVTSELGHEAAVPDDLHLSPAGHAAVAALLWDEVTAWLAQRPEADHRGGS